MSFKEIRVILYKDGDTWIAQGLEHDICVQARMIGDLQARFEIAVRLEDEANGGLCNINKAPQHYFDLWEKKSGTFTPNKSTTRAFSFGVAA